MPRVIHFDIPADDPQRAIKFYEKAFGWTFHKWEGPMDYWLITTGKDSEPGINGGMGRRQSGAGPSNTLEVPNIEEYTRRVESAGGKVVMPKMAVMGVGWMAVCSDSEGNVFGIMQPDPAAK